MLNLASARAYAARHPDSRHVELLAALDPEFAQQQAARKRPPMDLTAARARLAASQAGQAPRPQRPARPVNLAPLRAAQRAAAAARTVPDAPPTAPQFVGHDGTWRWASVQPTAPGGHRWERLAVGLVAAGPFRCLRMRGGHCDGDTGRAVFHQADDGTPWVDVVVDGGSTTTTDRVIAHELAHVADEIARLQNAVTAAAWRREFAHPHRTAAAEAFAIEAEEWVRPSTTAAALITAARQHQDRRG